jgi:CBS-domain-containing membrane protein
LDTYSSSHSDVLTAPASTSAKAALELLNKTKKGRLPLVNDKGQLVSQQHQEQPQQQQLL